MLFVYLLIYRENMTKQYIFKICIYNININKQTKFNVKELQKNIQDMLNQIVLNSYQVNLLIDIIIRAVFLRPLIKS